MTHEENVAYVVKATDELTAAMTEICIGQELVVVAGSAMNVAASAVLRFAEIGAEEAYQDLLAEVAAMPDRIKAHRAKQGH